MKPQIIKIKSWCKRIIHRNCTHKLQFQYFFTACESNLQQVSDDKRGIEHKRVRPVRIKDENSAAVAADVKHQYCELVSKTWGKKVERFFDPENEGQMDRNWEEKEKERRLGSHFEKLFEKGCPGWSAERASHPSEDDKVPEGCPTWRCHVSCSAAIAFTPCHKERGGDKLCFKKQEKPDYWENKQLESSFRKISRKQKNDNS